MTDVSLMFREDLGDELESSLAARVKDSWSVTTLHSVTHLPPRCANKLVPVFKQIYQKLANEIIRIGQTEVIWTPLPQQHIHQLNIVALLLKTECIY